MPILVPPTDHQNQHQHQHQHQQQNVTAGSSVEAVHLGGSQKHICSRQSTARMDVLRHCYKCDGDIKKTKAVVLPCECLLAFCTACARKQLFQTMKENVTGIADVSVYCPKCKESPVLDSEKRGNNVIKSSINEAQMAVAEWVSSTNCNEPSDSFLILLFILFSSFICHRWEKPWNSHPHRRLLEEQRS